MQYIKKVFNKSKSYYHYFLNERKKVYEERKNLPFYKRILKSKLLLFGVPTYVLFRYQYVKNQEKKMPNQFYIEINFDQDMPTMMNNKEYEVQSSDMFSKLSSFLGENTTTQNQEKTNEKEDLYNLLYTIEIASKDTRCLGIIGHFPNGSINLNWPTIYELKSALHNFGEYRRDNNINNFSFAELSNVDMKTLYLATAAGNGYLSKPPHNSICLFDLDAQGDEKDKLKTLAESIKKEFLYYLSLRTLVQTDKIEPLMHKYFMVEDLLSIGIFDKAKFIKKDEILQKDIKIIPISQYYNNFSKQQILSETNESIYSSSVTLPVIHINGLLGRFPGSKAVDLGDLDKAIDDVIRKNSKVVLFNISSMGGKINETLVLNEKIKYLRSKGVNVVCYLEDVATSGAYLVASSSDFIVSNPFCLTGSVGVVGEVGDMIKYRKLSEISQYVPTNVDPKSSSDVLRLYEDFQHIADVAYLNFLNIVSEGRKLTKEDVEERATYQLLTGTQAFERNLVDKVGTFLDAVKLAGHFGRMKKKNPLKKRNLQDNPKLIHYHVRSYRSGGNLQEELSSERPFDMFYGYGKSFYCPLYYMMKYND